MKTYRCKKRMKVEQYNAEGYWQPCQLIEIAPGNSVAGEQQTASDRSCAMHPAGKWGDLAGGHAGHSGRAF